MANGDDKNWMRLCAAVDGFHVRFKQWPKRVRMEPICYVNLVSHVLSPLGFALISTHIDLVPEEGAEFIADDDSGAEHCYGTKHDWDEEVPSITREFFGDAVLQRNLESGLEYVSLWDANGNPRNENAAKQGPLNLKSTVRVENLTDDEKSEKSLGKPTMTIYDKPVRILMKDMADAMGLQPGQRFTRQQAIDWFAEHYPKIKIAAITAHLVRLSINAPSRIHHKPKPNEDDVFFQIDGSHFRLYDSEQDPTPIRNADGKSNGKTATEEDEDNGLQGSDEFAYEKDLRNYLAKNLTAIEPGLTLYEEEGLYGIEFPVGGRFIDILAVDSKGAFVIIELKVSRGYDRVVGQLMRYMAWIRKNLAEPDQKVRGIIVARKISEDLLLACSLLADAQLFEYELSLALKQVDTETGT